MSNLQAGTVVTLEVVREAAFGYFLSNGEEDVLLHKNEIDDSFDPEERQSVFIYQDHQGRLAATKTIPAVQIGTYDWVEVVGVQPRLGVFVDIGIQKDMLLSKDDLPELMSLWPQKGDKLYCTLKLDKKGRLFAHLATEEVIREIAVKATREDFNKDVTGRVYRLLMVGTLILTEEGYIGFIHESQRQEEPRLGEQVSGRIIDVKEDGSVNVSLFGRKHEVQEDDAAAIYTYMEGRGGAMPFSDKSSPDDIKRTFNLSKAAFKRALGKLMKEQRVYQEDGWTYFKNK
ncbi:MAG TPA: S1 RNA-binding domain-containing protein [Bacilli bacterium]|nr:S1 RNA-binding domain-containing protein [Bacilli bacterium]